MLPVKMTGGVRPSRAQKDGKEEALGKGTAQLDLQMLLRPGRAHSEEFGWLGVVIFDRVVIVAREERIAPGDLRCRKS
jgi:hypothetical protein